MSKWTEFFDCIYLINLTSREDKLLASVEQLEKYDIHYKRFAAIGLPNGAEGLRDTVLQIFNEAIEQDYQNILILEDDFEIVDAEFNNVMDKVVEQLPKDYRLLYLGCQPTRGFQNFHSPNLLCLQGAFATHAWALSIKAVKEIANLQLEYPIDNFIVRVVQPMGGIYCTYPMLASQRPGISDICKEYIDWRCFMDVRYTQKLHELKSRT